MCLLLDWLAARLRAVVVADCALEAYMFEEVVSNGEAAPSSLLVEPLHGHGVVRYPIFHVVFGDVFLSLIHI